MKGVILAAGDGTRLAPLTWQRPKPLIPIQGRPLIEYTIAAFAQVGIRDLVVVVGYKAQMVYKWLGRRSRHGLRVQYVFNPDYKRRNATSLYAARKAVGSEPFILSMADHMISPYILKSLLATPGLHDTLCVDYVAHASPQLKDATRVWVEDGLVTLISKGLEPWNAVDTGVFLFTPAIFQAIESLCRYGHDDPNISQSATWLIEQGEGLRACDVSGAFWMDVDTIEDLRYVEGIPRAKLQRSALPPPSAVKTVGGKKL